MNEEDELSRVYASPREGGPSGVRSKKITISTIKTDGHPPYRVPTTEKDESNTTLGTHLGA
jgi:hypothetical protein